MLLLRIMYVKFCTRMSVCSVYMTHEMTLGTSELFLPGAVGTRLCGGTGRQDTPRIVDGAD